MEPIIAPNDDGEYEYRLRCRTCKGWRLWPSDHPDPFRDPGGWGYEFVERDMKRAGITMVEDADDES
jgi:hypothetical protein